MKATSVSNELGTRATEALKAVLHQVSTIELKGIEMTRPKPGGETGIVVRLGVLGHNHTLACKVISSDEPQLVRQALLELQADTAQHAEDTTPVFIAPILSAETQALCVENKTGFVDLEDNARLVLGEIFIGKRSLPRRERHPEVMQPQVAQAISTLHFPPARASAPLVFNAPAIGAA